METIPGSPWYWVIGLQLIAIIVHAAYIKGIVVQFMEYTRTEFARQQKADDQIVIELSRKVSRDECREIRAG